MKEINGKLLQERIDLYLEKNWDAILLDVDIRVEKMIKTVIKNLFKTNYHGKSIAEKLLVEKVDEVTKEVIDNLDIDKSEIERIVMKKVDQKVKSLKVEIN